MLNHLPNDPMLCLSVVNTKLRDRYKDLDSLCEDLNVDKQSLIDKLSAIDYEYSTEQNQFI
jgi:hypothetical protein